MGENEQGGMLRVVTVVGLIAIIAMALIYGVTSLKTNLKSNTEAGIPPIMTVSALELGQFDVYKNVVDGPTHVALEDGVVTYGDNMDVNIDTTKMVGQGYAMIESPHYTLPSDATRVKYSVDLKGSGSTYVHPWVGFFDKNGKQMPWLSENYINVPLSATTFTAASKNITIPKGATAIMVSMQSREDMHVTYRNVKLYVYNN